MTIANNHEKVIRFLYVVTRTTRYRIQATCKLGIDLAIVWALILGCIVWGLW